VASASLQTIVEGCGLDYIDHFGKAVAGLIRQLPPHVIPEAMTEVNQTLLNLFEQAN